MVAKTLNESGVDWVICGSTNFYLQGMDVSPRDIDVCIKHGDFSRVLELFSDFEFSEATDLSNGEGQERRFYINDVEVQICADYDFGFYYRQMSDPQNIVKLDFEGVEIPGLKLESELLCYKHLGRADKADKIVEFIKNKL